VSERVESSDDVDGLFADLLSCGENLSRLRVALAQRDPTEDTVVAVLRRAVPLRFLECLAATPPWSERPRVLAGVVLNPRASSTLSLRLLPSLLWRHLAEIAANPRLPMSVRVRAESLLKDALPDLRLGDRITLGRIATPAVLTLLLGDSEPKVVAAALENPRLRQEDLTTALRRDVVRPVLIEQVAGSTRWIGNYHVKVALVLQPRTPLALALAQMSSLVRRDLMQVSETPGVRPLLQATAARLLGEETRG
jgi:hypothetical protein